jgi:hypothetical protein
VKNHGSSALALTLRYSRLLGGVGISVAVDAPSG